MSFHLAAGYVERSQPAYFDDAAFFSDANIVYQPEVYEAADYFLRTAGRSVIIDIGCGSAGKLQRVHADRHIGIDYGRNIEFCRQHHRSWGEWHEADLASANCISIADLAGPDTVVVCADVVEHLRDPRPLIALLACCYRRGAIVITSTPDRRRSHHRSHLGPPPNPAHVREWELSEYVAFLEAEGLPSTYSGYTVSNTETYALHTIISIHDMVIENARAAPTSQPPPIAIMATFNEADVVEETVGDLLQQGCDVVVIDNWSTDRTWSQLQDLAARSSGRVRLERFPASGPALHYEWQAILRRKEEIATEYPGRWILHTDADEIRRSPFPGINLADACNVATRAGANRVDFGLLNFCLVSDEATPRGSLEHHLTWFEYGTRIGEFPQRKAWLQGDQRVDLASTGGHTVLFDGACDFRYRFLLKHYPLRSIAHGRRKIFQERLTRFLPYERDVLGWHRHYDDSGSDSKDLIRDKSTLHEFTEDFWLDHGLLVITDLARRRAQLKDPRHHHRIGVRLAREGKLTEARAAQEEAIRLDANCAEAHYQLSVIMAALDDLDKAIGSAREAIRLKAESALFHCQLGILLARKREWLEAKTSQREAIRLDPKLAGPHRQLGVIANALGDLEGGIAAAQLLVQLLPANARDRHQLGNLLARAQRWAEARAAHSEAIRLDPAFASAHRQLSLALWKLGSHEAAIDAAKEAVELNPENQGFAAWLRQIAGPVHASEKRLSMA